MENKFIPFLNKWKIVLVAILSIGSIGCREEVLKFHDYLGGITYAKEVNKPVLIVFSAYGSGYDQFNNDYLTSRELSSFLACNFIIIEMIVDDRKTVSDGYKNSMFDKFNIQVDRDKIKNLGQLNITIEKSQYKANSQPLYVILGTEEQLLMDPFGYQASNSAFFKKLQTALANFKKKK